MNLKNCDTVEKTGQKIETNNSQKVNTNSP